MDEKLKPEESDAITGAMRAMFLTAAAVVEKVTQCDVEAAQAGAFARGATLQQVASIDRADVAATLLRLAAQGKGPYGS